MRRGLTIAAVMLSSAALIGGLAGCGSSESASITPADASTKANDAPQTDSQGKTIPAPGASADSGSGAADTAGGGAAAGGAGASAASADVAAGKTIFEATCQGCHTAGGTQAGVGPKLQGAGLTLDHIKTQIKNGKGAMPGGLLSGADLDKAAAYVESIQK